jgi:hypothetical protein
MCQKLFIFGVGTDENGANIGEIVNGNLSSFTCRITICDSNAEHCLGLFYKLNQPLKVSKLIFHASQKIFFQFDMSACS